MIRIKSWYICKVLYMKSKLIDTKNVFRKLAAKSRTWLFLTVSFYHKHFLEKNRSRYIKPWKQSKTIMKKSRSCQMSNNVSKTWCALPHIFNRNFVHLNFHHHCFIKTLNIQNRILMKQTSTKTISSWLEPLTTTSPRHLSLVSTYQDASSFVEQPLQQILQCLHWLVGLFIALQFYFF